MAARCVTRSVPLPRYSDKRGWYGGAKKTLFTFVDKRTGSVTVRPVHDTRSIGPEVTVRVATRAEAEKHWQYTLHSGWKVKC